MGSALRAGNTVIECKVFGAAAVLAGVVVAAKDFPTTTEGAFQCRLGLPVVVANMLRDL